MREISLVFVGCLVVAAVIIGGSYWLHVKAECSAKGGVLVSDHSWDQYGCVAGAK